MPRRRAAAFVAAALAVALYWSGAAAEWRPNQGMVFVVDSQADEVDFNPGNGACATAAGDCTLRAALMEANARPGHDRVFLGDGTFTLSLPGSGKDGGDLDIEGDVTIRGNGPRKSAIVAAIEGERVIHIARPSTAVPEPVVSLESLAIQGGDAMVGGGIYATSGQVELTDVHVSGNHADTGGGVMVTDSARLTMSESTISGNSAGQGGGLFVGVPVQAGGATSHNLSNSTVSGNEADVGGGVANAGWLTLTSVTVTANSAGSGAGVFNSQALTLRGALIGANTGADCAGATTPFSLGQNLDSDGTCSLRSAGDRSAVAPLLGALADNGGLTDTHMPELASPAVDAGAGCPAFDQRGIRRPQGPRCDIGAIERDAAPTTPTSTSTRTPTPEGNPTGTTTREPTTGPSSTPTRTTAPRTATVTATPVPRTATATPTTSGPATATADPTGPHECAWLTGRAPAAAILAALADPDRVYGWGMLCNPNVPAGNLNPLRMDLSLMNPGLPYNALYNRLVFKCGCP